MLRSIKDIIGYPVDAIDGRIGNVKDCLFDDRHWRLRYLVVNTGPWLFGKKVLISPWDLGEAELGSIDRHFAINLTQEQIRNSPPLESDAPISRQYEKEYAHYYGHDEYWSGDYIWGPSTATPKPWTFLDNVSRDPTDNQDTSSGDDEYASSQDLGDELKAEIEESHLRSSNEIIGYTAETGGSDEFGQVCDFIMEDETLRFRYIIISANRLLSSRKYLLDIDWVERFYWATKRVSLYLTREQIEKSPRFDPSTPVNKDYLDNLFDYYGKPVRKTVIF